MREKKNQHSDLASADGIFVSIGAENNAEHLWMDREHLVRKERCQLDRRRLQPVGRAFQTEIQFQQWRRHWNLQRRTIGTLCLRQAVPRSSCLWSVPVWFVLSSSPFFTIYGYNGHMVTAVTMWPFILFKYHSFFINIFMSVCCIIVSSSFPALRSHGHSCDRVTNCNHWAL